MRQMQSRRQSLELFLQRQSDVAAAEGIEPTTILGTSRGGNFLIPSHAFEAMYYARSNQVLALESLEGEAACGERRKRLETAMKNATFVVDEDDIINLGKSSHQEEYSKSASTDKVASMKESSDDGDDNDESRQEGKDCCVSDENVEGDIELGTTHDIEQTDTELRLPTGWNNAKEKDTTEHDACRTRNRTVPGVCAICLCAYEVGDRVTYSQGVPTSLSEQEDVENGSPSPQCPHAFHTDCILQWLAKKNDARPECPMCRQGFCSVAPLTNADLRALNPDTTPRGTVRFAGTPNFTTNSANPRPTSMRMIALPINSNRRNQSNQEQPVMVLFPWP